MRNEVPDDENVSNSVVARRNRRRKQAIAGAAGLAVLGVGSFLVTSQVTDNSATQVRDAAAPAPLAQESAVPDASDASSAPASMAPSSSSSATVMPSAAPTVSPTREKSRAERIDEVKGAAAKANNVRRPLPQTGVRPVKNVTVTETGSLETGGTLRVVSGRGDLTGQRELGLAADKGRRVGDARCTQKVRFSAGAPAVEKPTLMICWRTSATRSVFTVAVAVKGRPSAKDSVAAITRQWAKLG